MALGNHIAPTRRRLPGTIWSTEFLMRVAVMGIERWEEFTPDEQERFRALATRAGGRPADNLDPAERKELARLWKRLNARGFVREALRMAVRGEAR
jgi:SOS response regulatory protein OraA/RecX